MIIRRIALRDFKRFPSFVAGFAPGFNVVVGHNEEGKSTLREAITLAFFQDPKTTDKKILAQQRWGATEQFAVEIAFDADGKSYVLFKDFQAKTVRLEERSSGERLQDAKAVEARIKDLLGLASRAVFESTVRISQRDVTLIQHGQDIADSLQKLLTGGEQDTHASRVMAELDKALSGLKTTARTSPGPLYVLPLQIAEKQEAISEMTAHLNRAKRAQRDLDEKKDAQKEAEQGLSLQERLQQDCAERFRLEDDLKKAEEEQAGLLARVEQVQNLEDGIAQAESELDRYTSVLAVGPEQVDEIAVLEKQAGEPAAPPRPVSRAAETGRRPGTIFIYVGIALAIVGVLLPNPWLLVAGIVLAGLGWWQSRSSAGDAQKIAEALRREQREAAGQAACRLSEILTGVGCQTPAEFRQGRQAGDELQRRLMQDRGKLEGFLAGQTVDDLEKKRKAAGKAARDIRDRLDEPAMRLAQMDHAGYQCLCRDVEGMQARVKTLREEVTDLLITVRANRGSVEELYSLEEETQELRERLALAKERHEILNLTRQVLEEARASTMVSAKDVLADELGKLVAEITCGRYGEVSVDEKLDIQLLSPERDQPVGVALDGALSTGTVEQVYLAARLAISRLLAQGRRPPMILDDPFLSYDDPRTAAVLALCRRLSNEHQILLFTCKDGYQSAADNVVRLPSLSGG